MPLMPHNEEPFCVADVRRAESSQADASIVLIGDDLRVIRLDLSGKAGELLCLRIAEALEEKYGPR